HIYTWSMNPRYPSCLGRPCPPCSPPDIPSLVPYLEFTVITKIASGGWMSAAVSVEGELFIWGCGSPGSESIAVLSERTGDCEEEDEGEGDEFIRVVEIKVDGKETRVLDVAVGDGHAIVLVEEIGEDGRTEESLWGAGRNEEGQLGLGRGAPGFVKEFVRIGGFGGGMKVRQVVARGWSSWVVCDGEGSHEFDSSLESVKEWFGFVCGRGLGVGEHGWG
ncbi:hypothetical protein M011DRAFT_405679, partial [Sporormia fimetaria CBS 119925]